MGRNGHKISDEQNDGKLGNDYSWDKQEAGRVESLRTDIRGYRYEILEGMLHTCS